MFSTKGCEIKSKVRFIAMGLSLLGMSHKTAPLQVREQLAPRSIGGLEAAFRRVREQLDGLELVVLSTCNRVELYWFSLHNHFPDELLAVYLDAAPAEVARFADYLYVKQDEEVVRHLFAVASSLDSMVVGETQILGQVREAYRTALDAGATGKALNLLFQRALAVGKRMRSETRIGAGHLSLSSVAVNYVKRFYKSLHGLRGMIIGSGKMGELAVRYLKERGLSRIYIVNRSPERARAVAERLGGIPLPFSEIERYLGEVEILICASAAPHYVLTYGQVEHINPDKLIMIDLSVPRNIEPAAGNVSGVSLFDIDDLEEEVGRSLQSRCAEVRRCREYIESEVRKFYPTLLGITAGKV